MSVSLPCDPAAIDDFLSEPDDGVRDCLRRLDGDILVAGAGGKMGGTLCLMLAKALRDIGSSATVTAVSRFSSPQSRTLLEDHGVRICQADLLDRAAVSGLPDAPNVVFMAGQKFGTSGTPHVTWAMNTLVPALVAERYRESRFAAFSTGCVYSLVSPESGGSREDSETDPPGLYAHTCLGREGILQWYAERYGTRISLIRLNYSVEFRYGVLVDIAQQILSGQPVNVSVGHVNVIWQRDACSHAIRCLEVAASPAVPVNVTGPGILRVRDLAEGLGRRLGRSVAFAGEEAPACWLNDASWSHARFGVPPTPLGSMLDWTAAWLQNGGFVLGKPTHFESRTGRF